MEYPIATLSRIADIGLKTVEEQILTMQSVVNSQSGGEYYYLAHALIRHYFNGKEGKYALIKKYGLNKHVYLLTRFLVMQFGMYLLSNNVAMGYSVYIFPVVCLMIWSIVAIVNCLITSLRETLQNLTS